MSDRLLLWDFDGTLADTLSLSLETYNQLATDHGFKTIEDGEAVRDMPLKQFLKSHGIPAWKMPLLFAKGLKRTSGAIGTAPLFLGIPEALAALRLSGFRHAIVSSNSTASIQLCLEFNDVVDLFDEVCGTSKLAGKERRIRKAMMQRGLEPDDCLYLGDEVRDIEAARAAHLEVGCVSWGLNSVSALDRHSPAFVAQSADQLPDLIQQHFAARGCEQKPAAR